MSVSTTTHQDVAKVVEEIIDSANTELRVDWFIADKSRPPVAVIGLPDVTWNDPDSGFCWATWLYPVTIIVSRNNDQQAQRDLSRYLTDVAQALDEAEPPDGVFSIDPLDARPVTATLAGTELPAYELTVRVRA